MYVCIKLCGNLSVFANTHPFFFGFFEQILKLSAKKTAAENYFSFLLTNHPSTETSPSNAF